MVFSFKNVSLHDLNTTFAVLTPALITPIFITVIKKQSSL